MARDDNDFVLYHPKLAPSLTAFGFDIPLQDTRSRDVFDTLKNKYPRLSPCDFERDSFALLNEEDLLLAHDSTYLELYRHHGRREQELKRIYQAEPHVVLEHEALYQSLLMQVSGTYHALKKSLHTGFHFFLGGGMHHASSRQGDGFCPFNDLVVAARKAQRELGLKNILIIDTDAHKGDGTAEIVQHDASLMCLSIHMKKGWPLPCETPGAAVASDVDIAIDRGQEGEYLALLEQGLKRFDGHTFDACLVVAGADAYEKDQLDSTQALQLSREQMLARDLMVFHFLRRKKVAQAWVMAGGYGPQAHTIYGQFLLQAIDLMG